MQALIAQIDALSARLSLAHTQSEHRYRRVVGQVRLAPVQ
jgi:hypothetical protein